MPVTWPGAPSNASWATWAWRGVRHAKSPRTTRSAPREQCPADLVRRHFEAFAPNELWVADITYVRTFSGWVYVAFVTDVFSRRIVGWQTSTSLDTDLALDALQMAVWQRKRAAADLTGLIHHSDRGVQYRSIRYGPALAEADAVASVGSKGDSFRLRSGRGTQLAVQGRTHSLAKDLERTSTPSSSPPPSGSTGSTPPGHTPPSACAGPCPLLLDMGVVYAAVASVVVEVCFS